MISHNLTGKGYFIWNIPDCEAGDPQRIAQVAKAAGLTHLLLKVADGTKLYNVTPSGVDLAHGVVQAARAAGLAVWGWHYTYGVDPTGEADTGAEAVDSLGLDGYVVDGEVEWKLAGIARASTFCARLRNRLPHTPIALSSYRYISYHQDFPWQPFFEIVDLAMPQVYWLLATDAGAQLARSFREYQTAAPNLPFVPTGAAWAQSGWAVTTGQALEFLQVAQQLNLPAANFWEWAHTRMDLPAVWDAIAAYPWGAAPEPIPQPAPQAGQAGSVIGNGLRIRTGPGLGYVVSGALYAGDPLHISQIQTEARGTWGKHELGWSAVQFDNQQLVRMASDGQI